MDLQHHKDNIYTAGQVSPEDVQNLVQDYGFFVIVNNRIDGEEVNQPESKQLEIVCQDNNIEYYYMPMRNREDIPDDYLTVRDTILQKHQNDKILFFCRTGGRSESLLNHE